MRILICNRRHCLSAGLIIIGVLSLWSLFAVHIFYLLKHLNFLYHLTVLGALAFYGLYFGIFSMFLESRNSISRTFTRAHNVIVLCIYVHLLFFTYGACYLEFYRGITEFFKSEELGDDYKAIMNHLITIRFIAILSLVIIFVQGYLVYARIINFITKPK